MNSASHVPLTQRYQQQLLDCESALDTRQRIARRLVAVRTLLFLSAGFLLLSGYWQSERSWIGIGTGWSCALAFVVAAAIHEHIQKAIHDDLVQRRLFRRLVGRMDRNWDELPTHASFDLGLESTVTADDLDLIGERSLISWCSLAGTKVGWETLANQLTHYADAATMVRRQAAARELGPQLEIRNRLMSQLWQLGASQASLEDFSRWATAPNQSRRFLTCLTWFGPVSLLTGLVMASVAFKPDLGPWFWVGLFLASVGLLTNTVLVMGYIGVLHNAFKQIEVHRGLEATCHALLESLVSIQPTSSLLQDIRSALCDSKEKEAALSALPELRWPMRLAGLRLHPGLYLPFLILQVILLWDFRVFEWIEGWRTRYSMAVPRWIASIGELEAALSAAAIHDENPDWAFPETSLPEGLLFRAEQLGHPLIIDKLRVRNDVRIDRPQPILLVTGSNMSGKSTLMRAVGVNVALARIGSPVCAASFHCQPMELATSIRVRDSLADGVSFFMAELNRLRQVVDGVQRSWQVDARPSLILLDEILQGTNSRERQIAVNHVVQTLLGFQPLMMVSTHDLELADAQAFRGTSQIVHFREHFEEVNGRSQMMFDYRMHPGIAPTTNALKLLELVGLGGIPEGRSGF